MKLEVGQTELPWRECIGPYRLLGVLGRGAMGSVYRARHHRTGEIAAVKTAVNATAAAVSSIRTEIRVLHAARHPSVVKIHADGIDEGLPWYAMDLLDGTTLRNHWADARLEGCPVSAASQNVRRTLVEVLRHLCFALSFLHHMGLVHRDLKPENIFICSDGSPVLVDFGIASRFSGSAGREALDVGGRIRGTAAYMAPEQIAGSLVDARADLYALGCILYEGLTGHPPFASAGNTLERKLRSKPPPPSDLAGEIPAELDRLALGLLEPKPRDRIGYADDVGTILDAVRMRAAVQSRRPVPRSYLHRAEYRGRENVSSRLRKIVVEVERGRGAIVCVAGERGIGKTRLANELATMACFRGFIVITSEHGDGLIAAGEPEAVAPPRHALRGLIHAIEDRCRDFELREAPPRDHRAEVQRRSCDAELERLEEAILALSELSPLLIVMDDLQWADEPSLHLFATLSNADLDGRCLLVVATYRSDEASEAVLTVVGHPRAERLVLDRMDAADLEVVACGMLALDEPPRPLCERIVSECRGNPFWVGEGLRGAIDAGLLFRDPRGRWQLGDRAVVAQP